jgi:hypothetical protein
MPIKKITGKRILNKTQKRKANCWAASASFFWIVSVLTLLLSRSSSLRLANTLTKILSTAGGCSLLNMLKPKKGLATKNNTAKKKNIFADLK